MSDQLSAAQVEIGEIADTSTRLKAAAVYLFATRGYHGTSIRDIAKLTGVTNAAVYHFVTNKEALLLNIMQEGQDLLLSATEAGLARAQTPADRLAVLVAVLAGAHGKNQLLSAVTDGEIRSLSRGSDGLAQIVGMRDEYERLWISVIQEGVETGEFHVTNQRLARLALINMCTGVSEWYRPDGPNTLDEIVDELITYGLATVNARRGGVALTRTDVVEIGLGSVPEALRTGSDHSEQAEEG